MPAQRRSSSSASSAERPARYGRRGLASSRGLQPPVSLARLKARYKELVKRHHPDANGGDKVAEEKLKLINVAYGLLKRWCS